jgi:hypothetical protein
MKGYKQLRKEYVKLLKELGFSPEKQRSMLNEWKIMYAKEFGVEDKEYPYLDKPDPFKVTSGDFNPRVTGKGSRRIKPKITPYDLDPEYRDPKEPIHGKADLKGVKQYPVTLKVEDTHVEVKFEIKSARLSRAVEILELKIGYDHKTNRHVLYSPLKYNERWDRQSQVIWLRLIGMAPVQIGKRLDIKYDTIKNWLRALKGQPLVATSKYDWAVRQVDGRGEYFSKFSSPEAKPRAPEMI